MSVKNQDGQKKIGFFIKKLRTKKGLTQDDFAKLLNTSQSAVARMERGLQNFTTGELQKISDVLGHQILSLSDSVDFKIRASADHPTNRDLRLEKIGNFG